jgi:hypothetical protein
MMRAQNSPPDESVFITVMSQNPFTCFGAKKTTNYASKTVPGNTHTHVCLALPTASPVCQEFAERLAEQLLHGLLHQATPVLQRLENGLQQGGTSKEGGAAQKPSDQSYVWVYWGEYQGVEVPAR